MACLYYYKGNLIGNEIQLNDFLIERKQFYSKYGDVVFKRSNLANHVAQVIDSTIVSDSGSWKAKMDEMWRRGGRLYDEDGEKVVVYDKEHPPFVGVNKYIEHFGDDGQNKRLTAELEKLELRKALLLLLYYHSLEILLILIQQILLNK